MTGPLAGYSAWLIGFGLLLVFVGFLHQIPPVNQWDKGTFKFIYSGLRSNIGLFRFIWPLGTTPVGITLILIICIPGWQVGLIVGLVYLGSAVVERAIKFKVRRPRPFESLPGVEMSQPKIPKDPSHPSGDSMRVWFLALIFPFAFGLSWPVYLPIIFIAITLSLGRITMGVHYPLDVIGGTGLGLLSAGISVFASQLIISY